MNAGQERLRAWIERSQLTQRAAAKLLGIHFTFLNQLLSTNARRRSPALGTALRIERLTGIPVEAWMPTDVGDEHAEKSPRRRNQHVGK